MYVLMEKISRGPMRVDVPVVNPDGIDGTYIVKARRALEYPMLRTVPHAARRVPHTAHASLRVLPSSSCRRVLDGQS